MGMVQIPMINFQIARCVLGWSAVLYGGIPHWKNRDALGEQDHYLRMSQTPDFKGDFGEIEDFILPVLYSRGYEVMLSMQKEHSVCILISSTKRYNASAPTPALAVALASLQMVGIAVEDTEEKWTDFY